MYSIMSNKSRNPLWHTTFRNLEPQSLLSQALPPFWTMDNGHLGEGRSTDEGRVRRYAPTRPNVLASPSITVLNDYLV